MGKKEIHIIDNEKNDDVMKDLKEKKDDGMTMTSYFLVLVPKSNMMDL
jgi:hypothetical protein